MALLFPNISFISHEAEPQTRDKCFVILKSYVTSGNYTEPKQKGSGLMLFPLPVVTQKLPSFLQVEYYNIVPTYLQQFVFSYSLPLCLGETSK